MQTSPADPPGGWRQVGLAFCHDVAMAGFVVVPPVIYARMAADLAIAPHTVASLLPFTRDLVSMLFYLPAARLMESGSACGDAAWWARPSHASRPW